MTKTLGQIYLKELESEEKATKKCLEAMKDELFEYKPHEKSMKMKSLALMLSDIPRWITYSIENGEVNFGTYPQFNPKTSEEMVSHFDEVMTKAKEVLSKVSDEDLAKPFYLKNGDQVLMSSTLEEMVSITINHSAHHRGQFTVYLRLNNIPVPSIYGPSADSGGF